MDSSGAVVAGATVRLEKEDGRLVESTKSGPNGSFHFNLPSPGSYQIEVTQEGFNPFKTTVTIGPRGPAPLRVVLSVANLSQSITVGGSDLQAGPAASENLDVIQMDQQLIQNLPTLGQDVVGAATELLDSASLGTEGASVVVDGLETEEQGVSASAIQEVRINQNPYSAEYFRPGHGRIEIITKPGTTEYHGAFNFLLRDHWLDARNAFAATRPSEQRRIYEGNLSGPIGKDGKSSFLFTANREEDNLQAIVFAQTPAGLEQNNYSTPSRGTELSARYNRQIGQDGSLSIRYEYGERSAMGQGVGGFTLPEAASDWSERRHHIYFNEKAVLSSTLINDFSMRLGHHDSSTTSRLEGQSRVVVLDSFTGGGAQADDHTTQTHFQLNDMLSWAHGKHMIKTGISVPDLRRRGANNLNNRDGTFYFSSLEDYEQGRPFSFTVQQGDGRLVFWQKSLGLFLQDDIRLRSNLSVGVGLRYDWQNYLDDHDNLAPRLSIAYAPGSHKTVLRAGAGIFYDRTGPGAIGDSLLYDGLHLHQIILSNPLYPDPFFSNETIATEPSNLVRFAEDLGTPETIQYSAGVERQLAKSTTLTLNYLGGTGLRLFRSRDVNAPLPLVYLRPNPDFGVIRQLESSGRQRQNAVEIGLRGKVTRFFNGMIRYNVGRTYNDTDGINSLPPNSYDLSREWARPEWDSLHRFHVMGTFQPGKWFNLGIRFSMHSGHPYNLTTGRDENRDGFATDRPTGVARNILQGPATARLDLRWSKDFLLRHDQKPNGPAFSVGLDAFNVLNHVNYSKIVGNLSSPFFGMPVASQPARRLQVVLRLRF